jgi:hypothetical protein
MTAPRRPSEQATIRGAIVVFIAVLVGVALLSRSDGGIFGSSESGASGPTTTTQTTDQTTTTPSSRVTANTCGTNGGTAPEAHKPEEVKVIVVNAAGGIPGIGSENAAKIAEAGFATLEVKNADQDVDTTGLFFREGYEADAAAVKTALGFGDVPVQAAPDQPLIPEAAEANVVVVLGKDYPTASGG